jgi:hypothetical protein
MVEAYGLAGKGGLSISRLPFQLQISRMYLDHNYAFQVLPVISTPPEPLGLSRYLQSPAQWCLVLCWIKSV